MRALRSIGILMVFVVAATLFAYLAFVHPIGTQFVRGKVTKVVAEAKKIVKEQVEPAPEPKKTNINARPVGTPVVAKTPTVPTDPTPEHTSPETNGSKAGLAGSPRKATPVATNRPRSSTGENPFELERSEFSRADIDAIIEKRRQIKDKLGEL